MKPYLHPLSLGARMTPGEHRLISFMHLNYPLMAQTLSDDRHFTHPARCDEHPECGLAALRRQQADQSQRNAREHP